MTKQVKEFLLDQTSGDVSIEYSDNTTTKYNLSNAVIATQSAQGVVKTTAGDVSVGFKGAIRGGRCGAAGDSLTAPGLGSWFHQICLKSQGRLRRSINAGVAGNSTAQILARIVADLPKSAKLETIFVTGGTNDYAASISVAQTVQNLIGMYRYVQSIGADPVLVLLPPRSDTAAQRDSSTARRAAVIAAAEKYGLLLIDPWRSFVAADGGWMADTSLDGIHAKAASANIAAQDAWGQLAGFLADGWNGLHAMTGVPGALIATNDFLADVGMDGSPDGWTGYPLGSLVVTKTTTAGDIGNTWRISTAGVDAGGVAVAGERVEERTLSGLTLAAGDRIAVTARVTLSGYESGIRAYVKATPTGGGAALGIEPTIIYGNMTDTVVWGEATVNAAGATALVIQFRLATTGTASPSVGFLEMSQIQVWNLTQMGLA